MPAQDVHVDVAAERVTVTTNVTVAPGGGVDAYITGPQNGFTVPAGETWEVTGLCESDASVVVEGTLRMRPGSTLRFVGVNENDMSTDTPMVAPPPASAVGLWFFGEGRLDAWGTVKTAWTNLVAGASSGDTVLDVVNAAGWQVGDMLAVTPTVPRSVANYWKAYDEATITAINGTQVTIDTPLSYDHPARTFDGRTFTAEVLNLTRDVKIEGTASGRSHATWAHQMGGTHLAPNIGYVEMRYMGAGRDSGDIILGRYAMHFHHAGTTTEGMIVEGVVVHDGHNHAFVPHTSHGIKFLNCIAHDTRDSPFWWDVSDVTERTTYEGCVASKYNWAQGGSKFANTGFFIAETDEPLTSFFLDCVAVGGNGGWDTSGAFWDNASVGQWDTQGFTAHNIRGPGIRVWQNSDQIHPIDDTDIYSCNHGIRHGAYSNGYQYRGAVIGDCGEGVRNVTVTRYDEVEHGPPPVPFTDEQTWSDFVIVDCDTPLKLGDAAVDADPGKAVQLVRWRGLDSVTFAHTHPGQHKTWDLIDCRRSDGSLVQTTDFSGNTDPTYTLRLIDDQGVVYGTLTG